jgi:hypothetical protein
MIGSTAAYLLVVLGLEFRAIVYMHEPGKTLPPHRAHSFLAELNWKAETANGAASASTSSIVRRGNPKWFYGAKRARTVQRWLFVRMVLFRRKTRARGKMRAGNGILPQLF